MPPITGVDGIRKLFKHLINTVKDVTISTNNLMICS